MDVKEFNWMIGLTLTEAEEKLSEPFFINIDRNDTKTFYKTYEFNKKRINVEIDRGKITKINNIE